ncbi:MAG TPA: serine hydrolase [Caulobacteraceae bacterium]|nr:serine hydrolase [Caulobacteraceae bacterium]
MTEPADLQAARSIAEGFDRAGCAASLHAVDLATGRDVGVDPDAPVVLASVFKVLVALEFYAQAHDGALDPARRLVIIPGDHTAGGGGLTEFLDPVEISLRDLCGLMLTISDNTATDHLVRLVGVDRINARARRCGCEATVIESDLQTIWDGIGREMGFSDYAAYSAAKTGAFGEDAQHRSNDAARIDTCAAYDPLRTNRSTARDMTRLLRAIWTDEGAAPEACAAVRGVMARQHSTRIGVGLPPGATIAAKTGSLTGRIRNEIGVVTHADGRAFAVAVFTRARVPFEGAARIEREMAAATAAAIAALRSA